jgi:hypothetical protein
VPPGLHGSATESPQMPRYRPNFIGHRRGARRSRAEAVSRSGSKQHTGAGASAPRPSPARGGCADEDHDRKAQRCATRRQCAARREAVPGAGLRPLPGCARCRVAPAAGLRPLPGYARCRVAPAARFHPLPGCARCRDMSVLVYPGVQSPCTMSKPRCLATAKMSLSPRPHMFITMTWSLGRSGAIFITWASA